MCKCKQQVIKVDIVKHSPHVDLQRNGDLIDLQFCGLDKVFKGNPKFSKGTGVFENTGELKYQKGDIFRVSLGVSMNIPKGKSARAYMRSSTRKNFNVMLTNHVGCLDYTIKPYNGTNDIWRAEFYALDDGIMELGDRILQFEIIDAMPEIVFNEVNELESTDRGGYGSTGI